MGMRIVVALGGHSIVAENLSAKAQQKNVEQTAEALFHLLEKGHELVITYGNGPQVGNLLYQMQVAETKDNPAMPLDTCVAMTQGSIGYWLDNALNKVLQKNGFNKEVASLVTQVKVDENDQAFKRPTKAIGPVLTKQQMETVKKKDDFYKELAENKWQKVVASPKPYGVCQSNIIDTLLNQGVLVIAGGGGGAPVSKENLKGLEAVVDKDYVSENIAETVNANLYLILMEEDYVYLNYQQENQKKIEEVTVSELADYEKQGQFDPGEMVPKLHAASQFVEEFPDRQTVITSLKYIGDIANGDLKGTIVSR